MGFATLFALQVANCRAPRATSAPRLADASVSARDATTSLTAALDRYVVDSARPWRSVLYSWTPPGRAATLAREAVLLTTGPFDGGGATPFSALLLRLRRTRDLTGFVARTLTEDPMLSRYRYAWASAYPTARGFQGRSYGTSLIRMVLRDDALVLRLDPTDAQPFRLYERTQRELSIDRFYVERARVAAVLHVRRGRDVAVAFREYVVLNASALAAWSIASRVACDELSAERAAVEAVLAAEPVPYDAVTARWSGPLDRGHPLGERWAATMATAAPHYRPTHENLASLLDAIRVCDRSTVRE